MSLNSTPTSERVQIGIFGKVNAGKSSVLNALTGQEMAVVSAQEGTTTDPVKKAMELLPIGPVMIYDTPGLADGSALGAKREKKTEEVLRRIDVGLVVVDVAVAVRGGLEDDAWLKQEPTKKASKKQEFDREIYDIFSLERDLIEKFKRRNLPYLVIANKIDRITDLQREKPNDSKFADVAVASKDESVDGNAELARLQQQLAELLEIRKEEVFPFSCKVDWQKSRNEKEPVGVQRESIGQSANLQKQANDIVYQLREEIARLGQAKADTPERHLVSDLIQSGDVVLLVIPIDESAPKGRLILPQQQVIRDVLDAGAIAMAVQPSELPKALERLEEPPKLVITDSQAFGQVSKLLPREIPLTSFSMLMARYKGDLAWQAAGAKTVDELVEGAKILISEGCTHHRQCGDIGTVKLPGWIEKYTGKRFDYHFTSGGEFPQNAETAIDDLSFNPKKANTEEIATADKGDEPALSDYDLIIHCGGCTLPPQEMAWRLSQAKAAGVPMTNYGTMIAYLHGILERAMEPLKENVATIHIVEVRQYYGDVQTEVYLSNERIGHIKSHHPKDYAKYGTYITAVIESPDIIFDDHKNAMTAMFVKEIDEAGMNVVVKLAMRGNGADRSFVVTMHSIGSKGIKRLEKKNKTVYSRV